ncbi:hypothetical protein [Agrobacterium tumefaciens]|uniref:hypothetical protein n=1 Tax=Agrobacterium tumefaciens TaxID=358 RepID=UPI0021FCD515|nr:hypothetical protein [Agrobacterium tumefaciens]UXT00402.1 hypothetical protein FY143_26825 [Agrobacterium tumefaciens]
MIWSSVDHSAIASSICCYHNLVRASEQIVSIGVKDSGESFARTFRVPVRNLERTHLKSAIVVYPFKAGSAPPSVAIVWPVSEPESF